MRDRKLCGTPLSSTGRLLLQCRAVAPDPPRAELPSQDLEEESKGKRNFYHHPFYAPPYTYTKPTTTVEPPINDEILGIVHPRFFD